MENCLVVKNIKSNECYVSTNESVLQDVTFSLNTSDSLGIISNDANESKLCIEILANFRAYFSGSCSYLGRGMYRKKRINVEHIFFIDNSSSLINDMNVLEYLMYLTSKFKTNAIKRQKAIFNMLLDYGFNNICLSQISVLTRNERMLVCLLGTIFSNSQFILINLNSYNFSDKEIDMLQKITERLLYEKTLIIATKQAKLIGICCNKILFINKGKTKFFGTVLEMQQENDNVMYILKDKNLDLLFNKTTLAFPDLDVKKEGSMVMVCAKDGRYINNAIFYETLARNRIFPAECKINLGRISNAIDELVRREQTEEEKAIAAEEEAELIAAREAEGAVIAAKTKAEEEKGKQE